ncbi:MAG TPA: MFS transporter [Noviherbaspirillum sp.]
MARVAVAFSAFFLILCSYYLLRPVRDAMAVQFGADRLQWLFSATFALTLLVVPLFGWAVRTFARSTLLPSVYGFLIINLLGFTLAFFSGPTAWTAAAFFVWLSVFNLFVVSLFWSRMGDCFLTGESHRLYGYIAAGGTCGALAGPALAAAIAEHVATAHLLGLSMLLLLAALLCILMLKEQSQSARPESRPVGGSVLAGIPLTIRMPDLRGIALLVICYTAVSTVLYIELVDLVGKQFASPNARTAFFARVDLAVNALALILQFLGTRKVVDRFGLRIALAAVPVVMLAGLAVLTTWRSATGFASMQTLHRAGEYALGKPGREMIYTTLDAESRYKAKNFIDTAIYRASDAANAWIIAAVRAAGLDAVLLVGLPFAAVWLINAIRLGGRHDRNDPT